MSIPTPIPLPIAVPTPVPSPIPSASRRSPAVMAGAAALLLSVLGLGACGGGRDDGPVGVGPDGVAPPAGQSVSIDELKGDWVQLGCTRTGGQSFKRLLRAEVTSQTTMDYAEGLLTYAGADCAGSPVRLGPSRLGTVTVARSESNVDLAAHWGELRTVTGTRSGTIWTVRPSGRLCLLGDEMPSNQPSLSSVSASLATIPAAQCFSR